MGLGSALGRIGRVFAPQMAPVNPRTVSFMGDNAPSYNPDDENAPYGAQPEDDEQQQGAAPVPPVVPRSLGAQMGGNAPPVLPSRAPSPAPPSPDFNAPEGGMSGPGTAPPRMSQPTPSAPVAPVPSMPQPPAPPNTPGGQKIGIGRQIGGGILQGFGPMLKPIGERIAQGSYPEKEREYERQMGIQKAQMGMQESQAKIAKEQAGTETEKQHGRLLGQQTETLAEEGKQKPIVMKDGGIYDPRTNTVTPGKTMQERAAEYETLGFSKDEARILAVGGKPSDLAAKPDKNLEQHATAIITDPKLSLDEKKAKLEEIRNAWNVLHPEAPIIHFESDPKGNVTAVAVKPSQVMAAPGGKQDLGPIGKPSPPQQSGINLTPEAVQFWGKAAAQGVPLPSMGMGASGAAARQQIINAAPGLAGGGDLAGNKATYHADTTSMAGLQKMRDAVVAFEGTANANLDLFMKQAKPVIDSGSPIINTPLRSLNRNVLGGKDLAAFDAARQVALTEIAKVVNNPNLTGQLTQEAKKEVLGLIPENATLGQIVRVVGILRQDMANRKKYLDQGISEIKGRVGGGKGTPQSAPSQEGTIRVRRKSDGQTGSLNAADFDPAKYEKVQ